MKLKEIRCNKKMVSILKKRLHTLIVQYGVVIFILTNPACSLCSPGSGGGKDGSKSGSRNSKLDRGKLFLHCLMVWKNREVVKNRI